MRILIADDEPTTRRLLQLLLESYGSCDQVDNGEDAVAAFAAAQKTGQPYELVCLDIMMPKMDGQTALKAIRKIEKDNGTAADDGVKIIMITCVDSPNAVIEAYYKGGCSSYLVKPLRKDKLHDVLLDLKLIAT